MKNGIWKVEVARLAPAAQKQVMEVMEKTQKQGKYKAQKTKRGKLTFDSKKEAERYDAVPQSVRVCYTGGVTWNAQTSR